MIMVFKSLKGLIVVSMLLATLASATPVDLPQQNEPLLNSSDASVSTASPLELATPVTSPKNTDTQTGNASPKTESPANLEVPTSEDLSNRNAGAPNEQQPQGGPASVSVPVTATAQPSSEDSGINLPAPTTIQVPPTSGLSAELAEENSVVDMKVTTSSPADSGSSSANPLVEQPSATVPISPSTETPTIPEVPKPEDLTNRDAGSSSEQQGAAPTSTLAPSPAAQPSVEEAADNSQWLPATTTTTTTTTTMSPPAINVPSEQAEKDSVTTAQGTPTLPSADSVASSPVGPLPPQTERHSSVETIPTEPETAGPESSSPESENVQPTVTTTTTTTTTQTPQLPALEATTSAPEVPSPSTTQAPPQQATELSTPSSAQPVVAPEVASSTLTEATSSSTTTTLAPIITEAAANVEENHGSGETISEQVNPLNALINHSPISYESDELHKVLREETTYKNGTVQGKITYVRRTKGEDLTTNTHFYSTDSITAPHLVISSVPAVAVLPNQALLASQQVKPNNQASPAHNFKGQEPTAETHGEHHNHPFSNFMSPQARWNPSSNAAHHQANLHATNNHLFNMRAHLLSKLPLKVLFSNVRHEQ